MDLDFWDCFGRKITPSYIQTNTVNWKILEGATLSFSFYVPAGKGKKQVLVFQIRRGERNNLKFSILLLLNICCDPSLEPSSQDGSNDGSQNMFLLRKKKIIFELSSIAFLIWSSKVLFS